MRQDYVKFCKDSVRFIPSAWFAKYFDNTQLQLDTIVEQRNGMSHIGTSMEQMLKNIDLLPILNEKIIEHKVISFDYKPFNQDKISLVFHPQYLKEYNGRWWVLGKAEDQPYYPFNVAIDRIVGEIKNQDQLEYIPAENGFYQCHLKNILGVTHEEGAKLNHVVIKTNSYYQHGLMLTKKWHTSVKEEKPFGAYEGKNYGIITMDIEPNREFIGRIMMYGPEIEILSPADLRDKIKNSIMNLYHQYWSNPESKE